MCVCARARLENISLFKAAEGEERRENDIEIRKSSIKMSAFSEVPNTRVLIGEPGFDNPSHPFLRPFPSTWSDILSLLGRGIGKE